MWESFLPEGIASRRIQAGGLDVHYLEAGAEDAPLLLLLHGFPELSYSWRNVMVPLAVAGWRVVAPDQRGYGVTTGWTTGYDVDLAEYGVPQLAADAAAFVAALGHDRAALVGHDFGSPVSSFAALSRPDLWRGVALMSAPFAGPPGMAPAPADDLHDQLAALDPPRRHYQWRYGDREAEADFLEHPAGLEPVLRAYSYCKSGDWPGNAPNRLSGWSAEALAVMPRYYIMDLGVGMGDQSLGMAPPDDYDCPWLTDGELQVYADTFRATGMQAMLNWYRASTSQAHKEALLAYYGRRIEIPACFIAGAADWGVYQAPGALEAMETLACADWRGTTLIDGAGHWVQQEKPAETAGALIRFLADL